LELVRYIHLNPLRARIVADIKALDKYPFCGHTVIMGKKKKEWQDDAYVLKLFDKKRSTARRRYKIFVQKGIQDGKRPELTGGGLIRSSGGWSVIKSLRRANIHFKSDERVLGDSDFVERVLKAADEFLERKYQLKSQGYDIDKLADRVADIFSIKPEEIFKPGKQPVKVKARSLLCYWAVRELGFTMADLAPKLNISQPAVSMSARRGERIASENEYFESAEPRAFKSTPLTLHRFFKVIENDQMIIDLLIAGNEKHLKIIQNAIEAQGEHGNARVAKKSDIIWLKRKRNSLQDQADIERLSNEED
jgi:REP-associated tyrosine transposase